MTLLLLFVLYALVLSAALARAGHHSQAAPANGALPRRPKRVLVIGATGGTGHELVRQALERGYAVTALVRHPSRLQASHPHLEITRGDVLDEDSVRAAMYGQMPCFAR